MEIITVGKPLRDKLGDPATDALAELLNTLSNQIRDNVILLVEHRFVTKLPLEYQRLWDDVKKELKDLRKEVRKE